MLVEFGPFEFELRHRTCGGYLYKVGDYFSCDKCRGIIPGMDWPTTATLLSPSSVPLAIRCPQGEPIEAEEPGCAPRA